MLKVYLKEEDEIAYSYYKSYQVKDESESYKLEVGSYDTTISNGTDSLTYHNNLVF